MQSDNSMTQPEGRERSAPTKYEHDFLHAHTLALFRPADVLLAELRTSCSITEVADLNFILDSIQLGLVFYTIANLSQLKFPQNYWSNKHGWNWQYWFFLERFSPHLPSLNPSQPSFNLNAALKMIRTVHTMPWRTRKAC